MDIRDSPIWNQVEKILTQGVNSAMQYWSATLLIQGVVHRVLAVIDIDFDRMYSQRFADVIKIKVAVAPSTYVNYMLPNKSNLQLTLYRNPRNEQGGTSDRAVYAEVFRALLDQTNDPLMTPNVNLPSKDESLDLNDMMFIEMQLAPLAIEQMRLFQIAGIYHQQVPGNLLRFLFNQYSQFVIADASRQVQPVDMIEPDNKVARKVIDIPDGIGLVDVPDHIQNRNGGIYNAGIDFYFQTGRWYIWPQYGLDRLNTTRRILTIFNLPASTLPGSERTYYDGGGQVMIIATGESASTDISEIVELNQGNGLRYAGLDDMLGDGYVVENNKLVARKAKNVNQYVANARDSGLNLARYTSDRITDNPYKQASLMAAGKGYTIQLQWESADPNLLTPGMATRLYVQRGGELVEKRALLIGAHYVVQPKSKRLVSQSHTCIATLTFFVERIDLKRINLQV